MEASWQSASFYSHQSALQFNFEKYFFHNTAAGCLGYIRSWSQYKNFVSAHEQHKKFTQRQGICWKIFGFVSQNTAENLINSSKCYLLAVTRIFFIEHEKCFFVIEINLILQFCFPCGSEQKKSRIKLS